LSGEKANGSVSYGKWFEYHSKETDPFGSKSDIGDQQIEKAIPLEEVAGPSQLGTQSGEGWKPTASQKLCELWNVRADEIIIALALNITRLKDKESRNGVTR
jgi:hypothetical protein